MGLSIEVGKHYLDTGGCRVKIVSDQGVNPDKPFIGFPEGIQSPSCYSPEGNCNDKRDLVRVAPTPHPHASSMAEYAHDAFKCEEPWKLWESRSIGRRVYYPCMANPCWSINKHYRRVKDAPVW